MKKSLKVLTVGLALATGVIGGIAGGITMSNNSNQQKVTEARKEGYEEGIQVKIGYSEEEVQEMIKRALLNETDKVDLTNALEGDVISFDNVNVLKNGDSLFVAKMSDVDESGKNISKVCYINKATKKLIVIEEASGYKFVENEDKIACLTTSATSGLYVISKTNATITKLYEEVGNLGFKYVEDGYLIYNSNVVASNLFYTPKDFTSVKLLKEKSKEGYIFEKYKDGYGTVHEGKFLFVKNGELTEYGEGITGCEGVFAEYKDGIVYGERAVLSSDKAKIKYCNFKTNTTETLYEETESTVKSLDLNVIAAGGNKIWFSSSKYAYAGIRCLDGETKDVEVVVEKGNIVQSKRLDDKGYFFDGYYFVDMQTGNLCQQVKGMSSYTEIINFYQFDENEYFLETNNGLVYFNYLEKVGKNLLSSTYGSGYTYLDKDTFIEIENSKLLAEFNKETKALRIKSIK